MGILIFITIILLITSLLIYNHYKKVKNIYHIKDKITFMWEGSIEKGIIKYIYKEHVIVKIERFREKEITIYKKDIISPQMNK